MSEEFEASEPSSTRTVSSYSQVSSDSIAPLSPDHPLTHASPTPTPTRVLFHRRTVCMVVRTQPTLSPGMSARIAEAVVCPHLPSIRGEEDTEENEVDESSDADNERESHGLYDEGQGLDDEGQGLDDEGQGLDDEGQ
ncbi:hypothetical protein Tco_0648461, partial [Tanacetum coccineum]